MILRTREPDIDKFLKVMIGGKSDKVHLFELFMDKPVYEYFADRELEVDTPLEKIKLAVDGFYNAGFDYVTAHGCSLGFKTGKHNAKKTYSANEGGVIKDWSSFDSYEWPDANQYDYSVLNKIKDYLPQGMKLAVMGPGGVLENVTKLVGYEDMCIMMSEDPDLLLSIFNKVGKIFVDYYENSVKYDTVAFLISNDDWGFKTQTFMSPRDMRKFVFPWHKKIAEVAHRHNKPIVLHSCGYMNDVFDDIIYDMKYDAKHSYEDNILSVEDSYKRYGDKITILGGLDLDFLINSTNNQIQQRCKDIINLTKENGRYMLGSGNSLAYYIPIEKIISMIKSALLSQ